MSTNQKLSNKKRLPQAQKSNQKSKSKSISNNKSTKNKNMEINMSTLSTAQKQMCIKLLAESNINFAEGKDGFQAQLRIDPSRLTSQFCVEKEKQSSQPPNVSPIKKRQPLTTNKKDNNSTNSKNVGANINMKQKQNISSQPKQLQQKQVSNNNKNKNNSTVMMVDNQKVITHPIYTNSKKLLSKTVKLNNLTREFEILHPYIQLYVYPKKMSFQSLIELIEEIYDLYWREEINGEKRKPNQNNNPNNGNNAKSERTQEQGKYRGTTSINKKAGTTTTGYKNPKAQKPTQNHDISSAPAHAHHPQTFCEWIYHNFILIQKQTLKIEQLLVNLIQSLNHFSYKHLGIQIFYNFFSGIYHLDTLNYFLVIRTLLEQIYQEKIIEKVSNYGSRIGVMYKMKLNPYQKFIEEEKVYQWLEVCCCSPQSNNRETHNNSFAPTNKIQSITKFDSTANKIFQEMTEHMFFQQKKKKNYIHFFQMTQILLKQFSKVQTTVNTTKLQLSYTQQNSTLNDLIFNEHYQKQNYPMNRQDYINKFSQCKNQNEEQLQVTFEINQRQISNNNKIRQCSNYKKNNNNSHNKYNYQSQASDLQNDLNSYLPKNNYNQLQQPLIQKSNRSKQLSFQQIFYNHLLKKYNQVISSFSHFYQQNKQKKLNYQPTQAIGKSQQILNTIYQAIIGNDKKPWIELIKKLNINKNKNNTTKRQQQELLFIQKLQIEYISMKRANIVSNQFVKKVLTASSLRQAIIIDANIQF